MTLYGATSILQVLPECKRDEDQTRTASGSLGKLLRPKAWTSARAWRPAAAPRFNFDSRDEWNAHNYTICTSTDLDLPNYMSSLRLLRAGAFNQGVFTSGSLTADGRSRANAFVDRWHCRRLAQRFGAVLERILEYLARSVRRLLRPKLSFLLDMSSRNILHKAWTAWVTSILQRAANRGVNQRRGVRVMVILERRQRRFKATGMNTWKQFVRNAVHREREMKLRRATCFERWKLFVLLQQNHSCWGVERAMGMLHRTWLRRLVFDRLVAWRNTRASARRVRDAFWAFLVRRAWEAWSEIFLYHRRRATSIVWRALVGDMHDARRRRFSAAAYWRESALRCRLKLWWAAVIHLRSLREIFKRWAGAVTQTKYARAQAVVLLSQFCRIAHDFEDKRRAFAHWKLRKLNRPEIVTETVLSPPPPPTQLAPPPAPGYPRARVCRCVRCIRKYGRLGARANQPRTCSTSRAGIVVTESRCNVNEHLELRLQSARRTLTMVAELNTAGNPRRRRRKHSGGVT